MKGHFRFALLVCLLIPALQGCFPLVATGMVGTGFIIADRRTSGAQLEDEGIELRASHAIGDKYGDRVHVDATSFNRNLLLTGEVPDEATRKHVETLARATTNVRSVIDETVIAGNSTFSQRSTDSYLSTKVHARLVSEANGRYSPIHISVTTENGVVYLMGLVTHAEGDAATGVVSTTSGVRRVMKVFEYIPKPPESEPVTTPQGNAAPAKPEDSQLAAPQSEETLPPAQPVHM